VPWLVAIVVTFFIGFGWLVAIVYLLTSRSVERPYVQATPETAYPRFYCMKCGRTAAEGTNFCVTCGGQIKVQARRPFR
jgi:hypothetical protein